MRNTLTALFVTLALSCLGAPAAWAQSGAHIMVTPDEFKWTDVPSLPAGAKIAVIEGPLNEAVPFTVRLRLPANYQIPAHWHPAIKHVTVISGTFNMGAGDKLDQSKTKALSVGSVAIMQPKTNHFAWTKEETIVQVHGVGPWAVNYVNPADDPRKTQTEQMQLVRIGEKPVAYHVVGHGTGTPLLVINGGPGYAHGFLHLSTVWERLAEGRRVVFFDQPGTGQSWSVGPNDSLVVQDILRSIEAIRETIGVPRLAVLGHSWGGYVALAYALNHPDHVERVVLVASVSPKISATEFLSGALYPERMAAQAGLSADNPDDVQTYIRGQIARSFYSSEVRDRFLSRLGVVAYNGRQETLLWKDAEAHDLTGDLNRLSMPVLVTTGRFDANVSARTAWRIHQAIPGSQFAVWEHSGHFPFFEVPDAFFAVVDRFLRGGR